MNAFSERTGRLVALLLIAGSGVVTIAKGMSLTFLAIRLQRDFGLTPAGIGVLIGAGPLLGAIISPFAGSLSDRIGRTGVLTIALFMAGLALAGLGLAHSIAAFALAHIVSAVAAAVYEPVSRALMSDAAPAHLRLRVFSWRYLAINAGWAVGPLIGVWVGAAYSTLFIIAGIMHAAFGLVLFFTVPEASNRRAVETGPGSNTTGGWRGLVAALRDRRLIFFVIGGTLLLAVHGQWSVTLSQYLNTGFEDGVTLFALLVSTNAATVLVASNRFVIERIGALKALSLGCLLFLLGEIGFAASSGVEMLVASMILFTIGEVLVVPSEYVLVDGRMPAIAAPISAPIHCPPSAISLGRSSAALHSAQAAAPACSCCSRCFQRQARSCLQSAIPCRRPAGTHRCARWQRRRPRSHALRSIRLGPEAALPHAGVVFVFTIIMLGLIDRLPGATRDRRRAALPPLFLANRKRYHRLVCVITVTISSLAQPKHRVETGVNTRS